MLRCVSLLTIVVSVALGARNALHEEELEQRSSCEESDLGRYTCLRDKIVAQHSHEEIQRAKQIALFKLAMLAETWACWSEQCACNKIIPALTSLGEKAPGWMAARAFAGYDTKDCDDAIEKFENDAQLSDKSCGCHHNAYKLQKAKVQVEMDRIDADAQRLADRNSQRESEKQAGDLLEPATEAAVQKCAPQFVSAKKKFEMGMKLQRDNLKSCLAVHCQFKGGDKLLHSKAWSSAMTMYERCKRDSFARALPRIKELQQKAEEKASKYAALYNKP